MLSRVIASLLQIQISFPFDDMKEPDDMIVVQGPNSAIAQTQSLAYDIRLSIAFVVQLRTDCAAPASDTCSLGVLGLQCRDTLLALFNEHECVVDC
ncbi:MAG: hypothetical protein JWL63_1521 [Rhodocyclales bacterium]|nr:hypothetical protein [Rhodocyclales bacterium]